MSEREMDPVDLVKTLNDQADQKYVDKRGRGPRVKSMPVLAGDGCWCGNRQSHDWPGKADGAPHPRESGAAS